MKLKTIIILCLYFSCVSNAYPQKNGFAHGRIIQEKSDKDTTISYQVYLPNSLTDDSPPILFIFDPGANSKRATELFKNTAEKCQTILICSDQSKNGPFEKNLSIFEVMYEDVASKINFNPNIQMLAGFSGGSRLATYIAVRKQKFCGVIACGAGLPVDNRYQPSVISDFGYYGIVGRKDMNYTEMLEVKKFMDSIKMNHYFSYTEDAHQWPSSDELTKALTWQLARMEQKIESTAKFYTPIFLSSGQALLSEKYKQGNLLEYQKIKSALTGSFPEVSDFIDFHKLDSASLVQQIKEEEKLIEEEQQQIDIYFDEFGVQLNQFSHAKPISWWKSEYQKWVNMESSSIDEKKYHAARIKNFMTGYAHQSFAKYIELKEFDRAERLSILIFEISEHKAYGYFIQAKLAASKTEYKSAEKKLELAIENGLTEKSYLLKEPAFSAMQERKGFQKLLSKLE